MTYVQAHYSIRTFLAHKGWAVKEGLKIPHATSPDGTVRLYFKGQASYFHKVARGEKFDLGEARSLHLYEEVKTVTGEQFLRTVAHFTFTK